MANTIRIKRRITGASGAPAALKSGELAYNNVDNTLYGGYGDDGAGNATSVKPLGGEGTFTVNSRNISTASNSGLSGGGNLSADRSIALDINNLTTTTTLANSDFVAIYDGTATKKITSANFLSGLGAGTVSSVALSLPSIFTVSGSPVTSSGTLTGTLANQTANYIWAGPTSGGAAAPTFRALVATDIPTLTAAKISDFDTQVRTNRLDQMAAPTASVSFNSQKITSLADPTAAQDAATKAYVDSVAQGLDAKESVRAATTANITLSGTQTIDDITLSVGDRVLVKNQGTASANGIYVVASSGWTRAADMDAWAEVPNAFVFVEEGTVNADSGWVCTSNAGGTLGSTAITWVQFSAAGAYSAGDGLTLTGNVFAVGGTTDRITVTADAVDIASTYVGQASITTLGTIGTGTWQGSTIGAAYGGTGLTSYTAGDLLYASGSTTLSKLAAAATGNVLLSGTSPSWGKVDLTVHVSGTLPVANGGTGATTFTSGALLKGAGTSAITTAVAGTDYLDPNSSIDGGTF